jgi:hypothetical protein
VTEPQAPDFSFSDLVAGYVTGYDPDRREVDLRTSGGTAVRVRLSDVTSAEFLRNLGEPYVDASAHLGDLLTPGTQLFAYGVLYPETGPNQLDAKRLVLLGRRAGDYNFEDPGWWGHQLTELARFYRRAQFGEGPIDYRDYRTMLRLGGDKTDKHVQETDTISRLVYGMASAYLLSGDEDHLAAAEKGTEYLRDHMRFVDLDSDVVYWYHGIKLEGDYERKLFTSEFDDDYDAVPMYEQIYALAGPTQTFRVTGDPRISSDVDATLRLF